MKAAYRYDNYDVRVEEVPVPQIGADEILMKVRMAALCGTDLRIYKFGHFKIPDGVKRSLCHEVVGEVYQVGENVKGYAVGDRIALPPNVGCGQCEMCLLGNDHLCPDYEAYGITMDGGLQEYMKISAQTIRRGLVVHIPENVSWEQAILCEPLSCVYNCYQAVNTKPGETALIIGSGPIGALHAMMSKLAGAGKVIVADISQPRLDILNTVGDFTLVNSAKEDLYEAVMRETNGKGADVVITACSVPALQAEALRLAAYHGRINFFGGLPKGNSVVSLDTNILHYKEMIALGTTGSNLKHFLASMRIIASGVMPVEKLVTKRFTIDQAKEAIEYAMAGEGMKTVIEYKD